MDVSDREHLEAAVKQFHLYLLRGLIITGEDKPFSEEFINSAAAIVSKGMDELAGVSPELKEKNPQIDWQHAEVMRDPLVVQKEIIENSSWIRKEMRDEIPAAIQKIQKILEER